MPFQMPDSNRPTGLGGVAGFFVRLGCLDVGFFELPDARELDFVVPLLERDAELRDRAGEDALVAMMGRLVHHPGPDEASTPPGKPSQRFRTSTSGRCGCTSMNP